MTILVLMGGTSRVQEKVLNELMSVKPSRIERLQVDNDFVDTNQRLKRYQWLFSRKQFDDRVTIVVGVETKLEVEFLRNLGATFCHVRGPLAPAFHFAAMSFSDLHVVPFQYKQSKPDMVLSPDEVISECFIRARKAKVCRK